jgi:DNA-binding NarL/FixJ family response regulator
MRRVRLLLADEQALVRYAFKNLLEPQYEVVGCVGDGRELLAAAAKLNPDVVVLEITMPLINGLDAGRALKKRMPHVKFIYLTSNTMSDLAEEAFRAGASGYVLKNANFSELQEAIDGALRGKLYIAPRIRRAMEETFIRSPQAATRPRQLTGRQVQVLQMLAEGYALKEIAGSMQITYRTVRFHKTQIKEELGVASDSDLVRYAIKQGMISAA